MIVDHRDPGLPPSLDDRSVLESSRSCGGCAAPLPPSLDGLTVIDLGCGAGRDVFVLSQVRTRSSLPRTKLGRARSINYIKRYCSSNARPSHAVTHIYSICTLCPFSRLILFLFPARARTQLVGPRGAVIGVDCADKSLALAQGAVGWHSARLGYCNVEFRKGMSWGRFRRP